MELTTFGYPKRYMTFAQLMGQCLSGALLLDDDRWEMPEYYRKFER